MKSLFVCFFIWITIPFFQKGDEPSSDILLWEKSTKLLWSDFKGPINDSIKIEKYGMMPAAVSSFGFTTDEFEKGEKLYLKIELYFDRSKSFSHKKDDPNLLQHEQCHFDMLEVYVRHIRKSLLELEKNDRVESEDHHKIINYWMSKCDSINQVFDYETFYGTILTEQKKWVVRIEKELSDLKYYEAKTFYSSFPSNSR